MRPATESDPERAVPRPEQRAPLPPLRWLYLVGAWLCVLLAILGVVLPVLPTTPFLLLASALFARSSPRAAAWLRRSRLFGPLLADWERHHGVRLHVKVTAIAVVLAVVAAGVLAGDLPVGWRIALVSLASLGLCVVLRLRTVAAGDDQERRPEP